MCVSVVGGGWASFWFLGVSSHPTLCLYITEKSGPFWHEGGDELSWDFSMFCVVEKLGLFSRFEW